MRPFEFHNQLIKKGQRADGRKLDEFRNLKLEVDAIGTAESSSLIKIGNTSLVCGCTTQLVRNANKEIINNSDIVDVKIELPPICSSPAGYRTQNTAHILTKNLKNILNDTNCIDKTCLYIEELDSYISISVEIICLNYDGSLLDASVIGVLAALRSLKLKCEKGSFPERNVSLKYIPICSSFAIIDEHFICDPNLEEETIAQSIYQITTDINNTDLCHINKAGGSAINVSKLKRCIELSRNRSKTAQQFLKSHINKTVAMDCA